VKRFKPIKYNCKQNENQLILQFEEGYLDEIWVGTVALPEAGSLVIGIEDLKEALLRGGYVMMPRPG